MPSSISKARLRKAFNEGRRSANEPGAENPYDNPKLRQLWEDGRSQQLAGQLKVPSPPMEQGETRAMRPLPKGQKPPRQAGGPRQRSGGFGGGGGGRGGFGDRGGGGGGGRGGYGGGGGGRGGGYGGGGGGEGGGGGGGAAGGGGGGGRGRWVGGGGGRGVGELAREDARGKRG